MTPPQEPPPGCQEIPGFILTLKSGGWLTKEGFPTWIFEERGVWPTQEAAEEAMSAFTDLTP